MTSYFYHLTASLGLTGITTFVLGLFVLWRKRAQQQGVIFFLWCLSISWWSLFELVIITREEQPDALFWGRIMQAGDIFLPTLFVHFVVALVDVPVARWKLATLYGISSLFAALCFSPLVIAGASSRITVPYFIDPGPLYIPMVVFFGACVLYGQSRIFQHYQSSSGHSRAKLGYFFWSSIVGYIGGCMNFLLAFQIEAPVLYSYGTYAVPVFVAATSYAIVRYRLMDITVVLNKGLAYGILLSLVFVPAFIAMIVNHRATLHAIPIFLTGTLTFACGLWAVLSQPRSKVNVIFGLHCLAICCWLFGFSMVYSSHSEEEALFWEKVVYSGVVYLPALFYHFCLSFLGQGSRKHSITANYLISTVFLSLIPSGYLINGHYAYFWGWYPKAGALHNVFLVYFGVISAIAFLRLYRGHQTQAQLPPQEIIRIKYVLLAYAIGYFACADFAQTYGLGLYPFGFVFICLWSGTMTYAIAKHRLMDISVVATVKELQPYAQALSLIPAYIVVLILIRAFTGSMQYALAWALVALFVIFSGVFANLHQQIERAVGKALFRSKYDAYETLSAFSKSLVAILDLRSLTEEIIQTLSIAFGIKTVSLYLLNKEKGVYLAYSADGLHGNSAKTVNLGVHDSLPQYLAHSQAILVCEELEQYQKSDGIEPVLTAMRALGSEICLPLINKDHLIGFCNLGPRRNGRMYSGDDLSLLTTLGQNAAIALDNAMLYEDLRRSQILMRRTDRLRSLETIAGGFAHEIRNPLTSIKTFVQLAPERKDDGEFIGAFSKVVSEDVERIERLIQEILDYARYMEPRFVQEDLNDVVASCLYFIEVKASSKSIAIEKHLARGLPPVRLDRQQIKQVLLNLFLNAMDAMAGGGGRLTVKTRRLIKQTGEAWVQIEVADTGTGIPADNLEHIFDPFYSTKHESGEREGTGLGLSIVHQIVQEHRGYIEVDSAVGSGTTFFVNLPVNPVLAEPAKERQSHEEANPIGR